MRVRRLSDGAPVEDERPGISLSALVAALTAGMVDVLYVWIIVGQEEDTWRSAVRYGTMLGVGAVAAAIAAFAPNERLRLGAASAAAAVFLAGAILGALSIGGLLVPPAIAALICVSSTGARVGLRATWLAMTAVAIGAIALVAAYV